MNVKSAWLHRRSLRAALWLTLIALSIAVISACAALSQGRKIEHGFNVENKGVGTIYKVLIKYGSVAVPFCAIQCLPVRGGGGWNAPIAIEDYMDVTWNTADGKEHAVRVPVKEKVNDLSRLNVLILEFRDDQLTVLQGLRQSKPGLAGWERAPLYP